MDTELNRDKLSTYTPDTLNRMQRELFKKINIEEDAIERPWERIQNIKSDEYDPDSGPGSETNMAERIKYEKELQLKAPTLLPKHKKRLEIVNQLLSEKEESSSFVRKGGKSRKSRKGGKSRKGRKSRKSRRKY